MKLSCRPLIDLQVKMLDKVVWPNRKLTGVAPPLLVVCATQHSFISYASTTADRRSYHLFEMTPFHWGSTAVGFHRLDTPIPSGSGLKWTLANQESLTSKVTMGKAMALSGAAFSASLGTFADGSWLVQVRTCVRVRVRVGC